MRAQGKQIRPELVVQFARKLRLLVFADRLQVPGERFELARAREHELIEFFLKMGYWVGHPNRPVT